MDASSSSSSSNSRQQVRYKAYVDNIATLMLHPEDVNLTGIPTSIPTTTTTTTITAVSNNNSYSAVNAAINTTTGMPPKGSIGNSSNLSMVSSLTGNTELRPTEKVQKLPLCNKLKYYSMYS